MSEEVVIKEYEYILFYISLAIVLVVDIVSLIKLFRSK